MKRAAAFLIYLILFTPLFKCERNIVSTQAANTRAQISIERLADRFGDHNDMASQSELDFVTNYFQDHSAAWTTANKLGENENSIPADTVSKYLIPMEKPFKSATDLRNAYKEIGIRTPTIGICKIIKDKNFYVIELYSCPGPNVYSGEWRPIIITE